MSSVETFCSRIVQSISVLRSVWLRVGTDGVLPPVSLHTANDSGLLFAITHGTCSFGVIHAVRLVINYIWPVLKTCDFKAFCLGYPDSAMFDHVSGLHERPPLPLRRVLERFYPNNCGSFCLQPFFCSAPFA